MKGILLHVCCGPCATHSIIELEKESFEVTLFFSNSNIHPEEEYETRLNSLKKYAKDVNVPLVIDNYAVEEWLKLTKGFESNPEGGERIYSRRLFCPRCHIGFEDLDPRLFSFNSRHGACPRCQGLGTLNDFIDNLILPDLGRSLAGGAIAPFEEEPLKRQKKKHKRLLMNPHMAVEML